MDTQICIVCQSARDQMNQMECGHFYCPPCLHHTIFVNHIEDLTKAELVTIKCKCQSEQGYKNLHLNKIYDFLKEQLISDSPKPLNEKCLKHEDLDRSLYCKNCQFCICNKCLVFHKNHETISKSDYANQIKNFLNSRPLSNPNLDIYITNFEKISKEFNDRIQEDYNGTIQKINDLIENLNKLKVEFGKIIKAKLDKGELLLKIINMLYKKYYLDLQEKDTFNDVHVLRYLRDIKKELKNSKLEHDPKTFEILNYIRNTSEELTDTKDTIVNVSFEFKAIPLEYKMVGKLIGHKDQITSLIQLQDEKICTGSSDLTIRFWEDKGGQFELVNSIKSFVGQVYQLCQLKDERILSTDKGIIKIWKINNNSKYECQLTLSGHKESITGLIQLKGGKIISSSKDKSIIVWEDINNCIQNVQTLNEHNAGVSALVELNKGRFASSGDDMQIIIWEEIGNKFLSREKLKGHEKRVRALCYLKSGELVSGSEDQNVRVWRENNGKFECVLTQSLHHLEILSIIQLKDNRIVTASKDKTIRIWKFNNNEMIKEEVLKEHTHQVFCVIQLSDGRLMSCGGGNQVYIWKNGVMFE